MSISVIICTRNRAASLQCCLEMIPAEEMRSLGAELVVVDNGSTDATPGVLAAFQRTAPFRVTTVHESQMGLGRARNAGIAKSSGGILFFTDDDCYIAPGTLSKLPLVYSGAVRYAGGRILLYDPTDAYYTVNESREFQSFRPKTAFLPGVLQGANLSCHRDVIDRIGGFDPYFGPGTDFVADDVDFAARASFAGFVGAYVPDLVVFHHHGRKPDGIRTQMMRDACGRGAYYAKMILAGHLKYAVIWAWLMRRTPPDVTVQEIAAAARYTGFHVARLSGIGSRGGATAGALPGKAT